MRNVMLGFALYLLVPVLLMAQISRHPLTFDDAAALRHADAIAVSPDGKSLLYSVRFGGTKGADTTEWYMMPIAGGDFPPPPDA